MTVEEWRKRRRNRKCKFCKHLKYVETPPNYVGPDTWCTAKEKFVSDECPRPFCKVFDVK